MEYAIETFSLTKIFSDFWGRDRVCAVDNLNLKVLYNEVYGLLGPNGSGKTTALKILLGLLYPTKGKAVVLGGDGAHPKINSRIGFLPEESYLYRYLNARETLDFYGRLFGLPAKVRKMRSEALLDMVGLTAVANRPVGTYSKGMARRIGLAQALINDPDLLILDEPTTGLDPIGTRQIKDLILELAKRGKTVLLCSHLLADVEDVCDRIAILYGGRIQTEGRVEELLQQAHKRQIITDDISDTAVEKIKEIVRQEQAECVVSSPMDRLETFFIRTVSKAEQQEQPTSGAVGTGRISDFLASKAAVESILDKLVSATLSQQSSEPEAIKTKQVTPAESAEMVRQAHHPEQSRRTKPDEQLLHKLTEPTKPDEIKPVVKNETGKAESAEPQASQQEQIKKSILDQLTGRSTTQNEDSEQTDKPRIGDAPDA